MLAPLATRGYEGEEMKITDDQVRHVAELARLALTEQEVGSMSQQLSAIVEHFTLLQEVDTEEVESTSHPLPLPCPRRADEQRASLAREELLEPAPRHDGEHFLVPAVIARD